MSHGFVPPPYPYDRLRPIIDLASEHPGGAVDLSIGTPCDPPPQIVLDALARAEGLRGYPPSAGTEELRSSAAGWMGRRFDLDVDPAAVGACIGTKELVASIPATLRLRDPARDTVLYPEIAYPTYEMGALLAGCRAVPVPVDDRFRLDLSAIEPADAARALCLWVNAPGNPAGGLDDLAASAAWGEEHGVVVCSDECYAEFTWARPADTILRHARRGVLAVHSLSKRSNLAGARVGCYAGDPDLVAYLIEVRKHEGRMVAAPLQHAAAAAWADDDHVEVQRVIYRARLDRLAAVLARYTDDVGLPEGGFYLWAAAPDGDAWAFARRLAREGGIVVSPGEFYGSRGVDRVRVAAVQPDERIALAESRLAAAREHPT